MARSWKKRKLTTTKTKTNTTHAKGTSKPSLIDSVAVNDDEQTKKSSEGFGNIALLRSSETKLPDCSICLLKGVLPNTGDLKCSKCDCPLCFTCVTDSGCKVGEQLCRICKHSNHELKTKNQKPGSKKNELEEESPDEELES